MKFSYLLASVLFAGFAFVSTAQATTISGTSGTYTVSPASGFTLNTLGGSLASDTKIVITYSYSALNPITLSLSDVGSNGTGLTKASQSASNIGGVFNPGAVSSSTTNPALPVIVTAGLTSTLGTAVIKNLSDAAINFSSAFKAYVGRGTGLLTVSYEISSIPLPPAFLLFGSGLMALAGVARKKTRR